VDVALELAYVGQSHVPAPLDAALLSRIIPPAGAYATSAVASLAAADASSASRASSPERHHMVALTRPSRQASMRNLPASSGEIASHQPASSRNAKRPSKQ